MIDTANKFMVSAALTPGLIHVIGLNTTLTKANALNLAAWLVALADDKGEFPDLLKRVQET